MKLDRAQREQFERDGYLFFPGLFTPPETGTLLGSDSLRNADAVVDSLTACEVTSKLTVGRACAEIVTVFEP